MKLFKLLALAAMSLGFVACGSKPAPSKPVDPVGPVEPVEGMNAEEAITEFGTYFNAAPVEVESGVYGFYQAYVYNEEDNNPTALMEYVDMVFEYVLTEFSASGEWTDDDGANFKYFINEIGTQFEIYVYEDNVWVKDGSIVDKETEGAEEVHVVCIEVYTYTVNE